MPNLDDRGSSEDRCQRRWSVLRSFMAERAVGAELGVFKGNFVDYLLATKPRKLYLVDPWERLSHTWNWAVGDRSPARALARIRAAYRTEIEAGVVELREQFSYEFLAEMPDDSLDWVYIDTNHHYESTIRDLLLASRKVRPDGFILGDDYQPDPTHEFHGVYKAVADCASSGLIQILPDIEERQFVCRCRPGARFGSPRRTRHGSAR